MRRFGQLSDMVDSRQEVNEATEVLTIFEMHVRTQERPPDSVYLLNSVLSPNS